MTLATRPARSSESGKVISAQHIHVLSAPPANAETPVGEPRITLIKDGDKVRAIEVTCTCGEVIRLDCVY